MKPGSVVVAWLDPGRVSTCFALSLTELYVRDQALSHRIIRDGVGQLRSLCGTGGIPDARNETCTRFLDQTDGEWLWFIDSDMGFAPDTVDRLVASANNQRPVMGGLCFQLKRKLEAAPLHGERFVIAPTLYEYVETADEVGFRPVERYPLDDVTRVAGTGAACLLIHRDALKKVRAKVGDQWFSEIVHPTGKHGGPRRFSEDLSFCVRLQAAGIPVHVDTSVKTTHEKGGIFLDEDAYDRDRALVRMEAEMTTEVA